MGTFNSRINPAYVVEIPDTSNPGQTMRPPPGTVLEIRDAETSTDLTDQATVDFGYINFTVPANGIMVATADPSGNYWVDPDYMWGPWWSSEKVANGASKDDLVGVNNLIEALNGVDQNLDARLDVLETGSPGGGGASFQVYNTATGSWEPMSVAEFIGPSAQAPSGAGLVANGGLWFVTT